MTDFMQDPIFFGLIWAIFIVGGVIIGWSLRAAFPEKEVGRKLARTEQDRNALARMYNHLKYQQELREADFKRTSLEIETLHDRILSLESEKKTRFADGTLLRKAEANARYFAEKVTALELQSTDLRTRNTQLSAELLQMQSELEAWQVLYRDFQVMQQQLRRFELHAMALETARNVLRKQLDTAQIEIENLQLNLVQQKNATPVKTTSTHSGKKGGPAAPEHPDDLKIINGITPFAEQQLHALGISTFQQISRWDDDTIIAFAKALSISPGKIYQEDWVGQARYLESGAER